MPGVGIERHVYRVQSRGSATELARRAATGTRREPSAREIGHLLRRKEAERALHLDECYGVALVGVVDGTGSPRVTAIGTGSPR